jgi:hypothetical protein
MRRAFPFLTGLGIGMGAMYLFDPNQGVGRRARLRDRVVRLRHDAADALRRQGIDLGNRLRGSVAEARRALVPDHPTDERLVDRIRAKLGHHTTHPRAIVVEVHDGRVTLAGPIRVDEVHAVLRAAGTTPGVREVENQLEPHALDEDHPALRGGREEMAWVAGTRRNAAGMLAGAAGLMVAVAGAREIARRSRVRAAAVR